MQAVFLVGAPRSGTTWLQLLLSRHPQVATAQETHLFDWYVDKLDYVWERESRMGSERPVGLRCLLTEERFRDLERGFAAGVLDAIAERKPGSRLVLEKTPAHIEHWRSIQRLFPEARFVHLIRDPRAVVASLRRAASSWGRGWAPRSTLRGARIWQAAIAERDAMAAALGDGYREQGYEDLRAQPASRLGELFAWLGLDADRALCAAAVAACTPDRLQDRGSKSALPWDPAGEPAGFYRDADVESWRTELGRRDIRLIEAVNRAAMEALGYRPENPAGRKPPGLLASELSDRAFGALVREIGKRAPGVIEATAKAIRRR